MSTHTLTAPEAKPVAATMAAIWQRHREPLLACVATLDGAALASLRGTLDDGQREQAQREAHQLADRLGALGFGSAAHSARRVERLLAADPDARALSEQVVALRADLELRNGSGPAAPAVDEHDAVALLIVEHDLVLAERLAAEAALSGVAADVALTPGEARAAAQGRRPDVVLLDLGCEAALELLSDLGQGERPIPVLVLAGDDALADRLAVARRGGRGFLARSLDPRSVIDEALQMVESTTATRATLLAVDGDASVLASIRELLEPQGLHVAALQEPWRFWDELERVGPDLVLLDADMLDLNGIDLCRVMRHDRRWSALPVVLCSTRREPRLIHDAFAAGADDLVAKPFLAVELIARVRSRLERPRRSPLSTERDALTGVADRSSCVQAVERLLALSKRYGEPVTLAAIDLDRFKVVNDAHGHVAGDAVLRRLGELLVRSFRGEDVVGRWTGAEFLVGMYGMARHDALRRLRDLQATFAREGFAAPDGTTFHGAFSAGIGVFGEDGDDLRTLHRAADQALHAAKAAGGRRVRAAGGKDDIDVAERIDVVVVEADAALGDVLLHALSTRGHRARVLRDGAEAAEALAGERPTLRARVVLLDVDLPSLDGVAVLRRLRTHDVLKRTNVIMLTGRTGERTVLETLGLGAFDHLAKPFSLPVVMSKIARALEARPSSRMAS